MFLDKTGIAALGYHGITTVYAIFNGVALFLLIFVFKEEKVDFFVFLVVRAGVRDYHVFIFSLES